MLRRKQASASSDRLRCLQQWFQQVNRRSRLLLAYEQVETVSELCNIFSSEDFLHKTYAVASESALTWNRDAAVFVLAQSLSTSHPGTSQTLFRRSPPQYPHHILLADISLFHLYFSLYQSHFLCASFVNERCYTTLWCVSTPHQKISWRCLPSR